MDLSLALRGFAHGFSHPTARERGGIVLDLGGRLHFQELPNRSPRDDRFRAAIPAIRSLPGRLVGFWHTHAGRAVPSPIDLRELWRVDRRFRRSFVLCTIGKQGCSIFRFGRFGCPRWRYYATDATPDLNG